MKVNAKDLIQRRDLIRTLRVQGLSRDEILEAVKEEGFLEGYSQDRKAQLKVLREDVEAILESDKERFSVGGKASEDAREEYILRLLDIFRAAFKAKQYATARNVAKDIAIQFGINTEEPIKIKHEGSIEHIHSIKDLVMEYPPSNRIGKEMEQIMIKGPEPQEPAQ